MAKVRIIMTAILEYTPNPEYYPNVDSKDFAGMVDTDMSFYDNDPMAFLEHGDLAITFQREVLKE